jgi:hypothetical protein
MPSPRTLSLRDGMSAAGISKWIDALGVSDAPARRAGVTTALGFFASRMPMLPPDMALNFLLAMDLSHPVTTPTLAVGTPVIAFRHRAEQEFKLFYTRPGASMHASGINPNGRVPVQYRVHAPTRVLESFTTGAIDVWSVRDTGQALSLAVRANTVGVMASGGGIQLIIPDAARTLTLTRVGT